MRIIKNSILFAAVAIVLSSCGSSTAITGSWKEPSVMPKAYQKVVVVALSQNESRQRMAEDFLVQALAKEKVSAEPAYRVFPANYLNSNPSKADIVAKLKAANADALMTIALVDTKDETHYVPGTTTYAPYGMYPRYGSWYGYYSHYSPMVYDPGYYEQLTNFFLETNFYSIDGEKLIWSAQSKTTDPTNYENFAKSYAYAVAKRMRKDGVLTK